MSTVRDLSIEEVKALIEEVGEEKLREMPGDPDEDLALRPDIQERLVKSLNQPKEPRQRFLFKYFPSFGLRFSRHGVLPNLYMLSLFKFHHSAVIGICSFR
jgi:hypothetical protein